jgi:hypothetical protein
MSDQPIELRLECWTDWALYLKRRIETHYRPRIAELGFENLNMRGTITSQKSTIGTMHEWLKLGERERDEAKEKTRFWHERNDQLVDELAITRRMLRLFVSEYLDGTEPGWYTSREKKTDPWRTVDEVLADLRARAEEGSRDDR